MVSKIMTIQRSQLPDVDVCTKLVQAISEGRIESVFYIGIFSRRILVENVPDYYSG